MGHGGLIHSLAGFLVCWIGVMAGLYGLRFDFFVATEGPPLCLFVLIACCSSGERII